MYIDLVDLIDIPTDCAMTEILTAKYLLFTVTCRFQLIHGKFIS